LIIVVRISLEYSDARSNARVCFGSVCEDCDRGLGRGRLLFAKIVEVDVKGKFRRGGGGQGVPECRGGEGNWAEETLQPVSVTSHCMSANTVPWVEEVFDSVKA
jgi:hypothetical protein